MMIYELDLLSIDVHGVYYLIIFQNVEVTSISQALARRNIKKLKKGGQSWDLILIIAFSVFHLAETFIFKGCKP